MGIIIEKFNWGAIYIVSNWGFWPKLAEALFDFRLRLIMRRSSFKSISSLSLVFTLQDRATPDFVSGSRKRACSAELLFGGANTTVDQNFNSQSL
jgi:hypothetical protein